MISVQNDERAGERNLFWRKRVLHSSVAFSTNHYVVFFYWSSEKEKQLCNCFGIRYVIEIGKKSYLVITC